MPWTFQRWARAARLEGVHQGHGSDCKTCTIESMEMAHTGPVWAERSYFERPALTRLLVLFVF